MIFSRWGGKKKAYAVASNQAESGVSSISRLERIGDATNPGSKLESIGIAV